MDPRVPVKTEKTVGLCQESHPASSRKISTYTFLVLLVSNEVWRYKTSVQFHSLDNFQFVVKSFAILHYEY